jgi:glutaminyl-tRNA synthetase
LSSEELFEVFKGISIEEKTAERTSKKPKLAASLLAVITEAGLREKTSAASSCDKKRGNLLYTVAMKFPLNALSRRPLVVRSVMENELRSNAQLEGTFEYFSTLGEDAQDEVDLNAYRQAGGIGVEVTDADIAAAFAELLETDLGRKLETERYGVVPRLLAGLRGIGNMKWADQKTLKMTFDKNILDTLGPRNELDKQMAKTKAKAGKKKPSQPAAGGGKDKKKGNDDESSEPKVVEDPFAFFSKPENNNAVHTSVNFSAGHVMRISNPKSVLEKHLKETGGKHQTRFPPEPNGYLHIGHAKAMFIDFGLASRYGGSCYLRYDDTNPTAEKEEYIEHIQEIVRWMGWKPWKITYSSDYFQTLYELAVKLIETGNAYVDHQTAEEVSEYRQQKKNSPWRDRPVAESLKLFEDMRLGLVDEGKATLRMKMDMQNENFNMCDLIAYRIKFAKHPKAGDKWCIYPSYDFTHCIVDSLENITHSLCTIEFEVRRASYYWLLEVLGMYKPVVWEYSRLNITNTVMSKRKLNKLVTDKYVSGWDDPRLLTLSGLRRRGATPQAINNFCRELGITRSDQEIPMHKLEYHMRNDLENVAERRLGVLRPLRVEITNSSTATKGEKVTEVLKAKKFPGKSDETYDISVNDTVYIEENDFREEDQKNYYGMALGKTVMLRYAFAIKCYGYVKDEESGKVILVRCERVEVAKAPKGVLHWVASPEGLPKSAQPVRAEVRLYSNLFQSESVAEVEDWLTDLNPSSLEVAKGCLVCSEFRNAQVGDKFQIERVGYFCVDPDTTEDLLVLNRICSLKESLFTKGVKGSK